MFIGRAFGKKLNHENSGLIHGLTLGWIYNLMALLGGDGN
jgi:hypothetical protein